MNQSKLARRKFLSLLAISPAAAPVVAKEAASKMGLSSVASAGLSEYGGMRIGNNHFANPVPDRPQSDWIAEQVKQFMSPEAKRGRLMEAKRSAGRLDPDLAAMKSVSPSWAYAAQCERVLAEIEQRESGWLRQEANRAGLGWMLP